MTYAHPEALVDTDWLAAHLDAPDLRIVDATHFAPIVDREADFEHELRHIPGAVWFDIDSVCAECSPLPHMLPPTEQLAGTAGRLGLGDGHRIVVYDALGGCCAAARVWFMLRMYGHRDVAVLDGGLLKWMREKRPLEASWNKPRPVRFTARAEPARARDWRQLLANLETRREQVVDARAPARFAGQTEEVYPTRRLGRIPGSVNLPFTNLLQNYRQDYVMRPAEGIRAAFDAAGVDLARPIVATCGTGVTACVTLLALHLIGIDDTALYDGSWNEWGNRSDLPLEV